MALFSLPLNLLCNPPTHTRKDAASKAPEATGIAILASGLLLLQACNSLPTLDKPLV
jgi:hypothetical protein